MLKVADFVIALNDLIILSLDLFPAEHDICNCEQDRFKVELENSEKQIFIFGHPKYLQ